MATEHQRGGEVPSNVYYVGAEVTMNPNRNYANPDEYIGNIRHELGHVMGLDHVESTEEVMYWHATVGTNDWGEGDRFGLRALGTYRCQ